jgi:hypothetical protein
MVVVFLLLGVLVPTASVLWFINANARSEAAAASQTVTDAYRGQLRLVRGRIDSYWNERAALLAQKGASGRPTDFKRIVVDGLADSVLFVDDRGSPVYPEEDRALWIEPDPEPPEWQAAQTIESSRGRWSDAAAAYARLASTAATPSLAARAAQAEVRCLVQGDNKEAALRTIQRHFVTGGAARGVDLQGRLIAGDELLLSMQLLKSDDPRFAEYAARLATILTDYDGVRMPSAQRLFLMNE